MPPINLIHFDGSLASALPALDCLFCTHIHGDHLDLPSPESIAKNQPKTRFILPGDIEGPAIEVAKQLQVLKAETGTRYTFNPRSRA
ncbi:MAG TPA: hypothetical protein VHS80_05650 [Chthoniobacterales bacterium]|nr:hypothetical protein [Chthoniobacterales bacterium]